MSETQILASTQIDQDNKKEAEIENKMTENTKAEPDVEINDADLEDGEIDDDGDDDDVVITSVAKNFNDPSGGVQQKQQNNSNSTSNKGNLPNDDVITIDLLDDCAQPSSPSGKPLKSKKSNPLEDDHASSIEHALANVLKKKGIDPVLSVVDVRNEHSDHQETHHGSSRSSRRRKRKKQREEKDKQKGSSEKKKSRYESPEASKSKVLEIEDDELMQDYEMLNVRGGSPPPMSHLPNKMMPAFNDQYDSAENSSYSYESYDSENEPDSPSESRRKRRNKKDKESRKRKDRRNRNDAERQDKRNRRGESPDRQEPRKLELCKFYLMECCAKRDKCSYMHGDFPCKYYYLGMDCTLGDECKFSHGEPLSEQLRNILLKHLETAPKEILGNFKRISREQAITQMTKRHEELCKKFNVQNVWSNFLNLPSNHNRRNINNDHQQNQQQFHSNNNNQMQQQQQQQQHQQHQQQQHNVMHSNIPSLLDLDIRPPLGDLMDLGKNGGLANVSTHDKQRKSRWCDNTTKDGGNVKKRPNLEPPANNAPSYLDLKNLTGILSEEHIKQLSDIGIVNLEQVNQLTVGQLNQIGLTIAEINEIQLNAKNMANLGVPVGGNTKVPVEKNIGTTLSATEKNSPKTDKSSSTLSNSEKVNEEITAPIVKSLRDETTNSNSNSSSGVIMVDYSQYLKDSNLPFDRGDDDERDDEQLIIDDGNADNDESPFGTPSKSGHNDTKKLKDSFSDNEQESSLSTMHKLVMPDFTNALRNPFSSIPPITGLNRHQDPRVSSHQENELDVFKLSNSELGPSQRKSKGNDSDSDDESYYASRGRRSRSVTPTRSGGSSTPEGSPSPPTDDFGLTSKPRSNPKYERNTMYDFDIKRAVEEDAAHAAKSMKADKDMRFMEGTGVGSGDIDLRLPFLPVTNYTPATEIDGSITSHLPMTYKVYEVDITSPSYVELRQNFKSDQTSDPRLRRILGLPETATTRTAVALSRTVRKLSTTIASPESSDGASPKYYTPSMSSNVTEDRIRRNSHSRTTEPKPTAPAAPASSGPPQLRVDPRRAARQAAEAASTAQNSPPVQTTAPSNANKQNVEIRNYLQKSEWYKNLNSKFKIMVNQQLALVSTELKKFHQDPSPTKIFDISFIVNNSTLQQILTNLGIYIDDNGEVAHIDGDADETEQASQDSNNKTTGINSNIVLPNLSQPPPTQPQQLDFLRAPPPNMFGQNINMQQFATPPPNTRPSLLGLPPGAPSGLPRNPFNPFSGNVVVPFVGGPNGPQLLGPNAPSLLGPGPGVVQGLNGPMGFQNFGMTQNMQQKRNFGNAANNNKQRNQRQRRNNFNGTIGNK